MKAIRDDETAAAAAGVAVFRTKLLGLLLSAVMTSFAGTLYMQSYQAIDPETAFGLSQAIQLQLPALIGGLGTSWGPIIGGTIMILLSESTNWGSTRLGIAGVDILVYGLLLLAVVMYAPKGIMGLFGKRTRGVWHP
jgi:branched-chain amino acid transport system permease protein